MKQNQAPGHSAPSVPGDLSTLQQMAAGLIRCVEDFSREGAPPLDVRCAAVGFSNAVFLAAKLPDSADALWQGFQAAGVAGDRVAGLDAFRRFDPRGDWIRRHGETVVELWSRPQSARADHLVGLTLFSVATGLLVGRETPEFTDEMAAVWPDLNSESQFLAARLIAWDDEWLPRHVPFLEFALGWYAPGTRERAVMRAAVEEALPRAFVLPDPWALAYWADAGWAAGRRIVEVQPHTVGELVAEVPRSELATYDDLYRRCVLQTAAADGQVRPERAALRYFATTARDAYARAYCRGDQPRYVARAAFDLTFWMALLSGSPIPVPAHAR